MNLVLTLRTLKQNVGRLSVKETRKKLCVAALLLLLLIVAVSAIAYDSLLMKSAVGINK